MKPLSGCLVVIVVLLIGAALLGLLLRGCVAAFQIGFDGGV